MMEQEISQQQYIDLQKYIEGNMAPGEREIFENELQSNELLKGYLEFELGLDQYLVSNFEDEDETVKILAEAEAEASAEEIQKWKEKITAAAAEWKQISTNVDEKKIIALPQKEGGQSFGVAAKTVSIKRNIYKWIAVAACLLGALLIWKFGDWGKKPTPPEIVHNKTKPSDSTHPKDSNIAKTTIDTNKNKIEHPPKQVFAKQIFKREYKIDKVPDKKPTYLATALDSFANKEYVAVLDKKLTDDDVPNPNKTRGDGDINSRNYVQTLGKYYQGLAYLEKGENASAIKAFEWVRDNPAADSIEYKATWYLAMAYLADDKPEAAKKMFQVLVEVKHASPYYLKSKELLKELE